MRMTIHVFVVCVLPAALPCGVKSAAGTGSNTLDAAQVQRLWEDLSDANADKAHRAVAGLAAAGDKAAGLLAERVKVFVANVGPARVRQLIGDLDDDTYATREAASKELSRIGRLAEPVLRDALKRDLSLEVRQRVEAVLAAAAKQPGASPETRRLARATLALELIGTDKARRVLKRLEEIMPARPAGEGLKLIRARPVFLPEVDELWRTQSGAWPWAMRLSPDGANVLYPRPRVTPSLMPQGPPEWNKLEHEIVLRDLSTRKDTVLPISPWPSRWKLVFMQWNPFDLAGRRLALAEIDVSRTASLSGHTMRMVLYDIPSGKLIPTQHKGRVAMGRFDRTGAGLIVMKGSQRDLGLYTAALPGLELKPVQTEGYLHSVCPAADVVCIWTAPKRLATTGPRRRPERGRQRLFLYDLKAGKEIAELPVHARSDGISDVETQWTPDGRYVYSCDVEEDPADTSAGPRRKIRSIARIWDRVGGREVGKLVGVRALGPGPAPTTVVLAGRSKSGYDRFCLHDAASKAEWPLGDAPLKPIHAWGKHVLYARELPDGTEAVYVAEIDMSGRRR